MYTAPARASADQLWPPRAWRTTPSRPASIPRARSSASGASASALWRLPGPRRAAPRRAPSPLFPPASSSPSRRSRVSCRTAAGVPLSRWSRTAELRRAVFAAGPGRRDQRDDDLALAEPATPFARGAIAAGSSRATPPSPPRRGAILDLYAGRWQGRPLGPREYVLCADEKTSIQARRRRHALAAARAAGRPRGSSTSTPAGGAWAYLAAWDVHRAKVFGRCERTTGIAPFRRLVRPGHAPGALPLARRVFWIVDNGSSHRGDRRSRRLQAEWPRLVLVHTPVHASWLNQIEIYFSIVQRQVLTPNDFPSLAAVKDRLLRFQAHYAQAATPFQWTFTRAIWPTSWRSSLAPSPPRRMNPVKYVRPASGRTELPTPKLTEWLRRVSSDEVR